MTAHAISIKEKVSSVCITLVNNILKVKKMIGLQATLRLLQLPYGSYLALRNTKRCGQSLLNLCRSKHPAQLLQKEILSIKNYCNNQKYIHWPLASVYHQLKREGDAFFCVSTFYKYVGLLNLQRSKALKRRKNHTIGIRALRPLQILHADATLFILPDNTKVYIYLVQDNFSRAILSYRTAFNCKAVYSLENLKEVYKKYLAPQHLQNCTLITDDGSENHGAVTEFTATVNHPSFNHLIAQKTIVQSNSMIEAANKQLKYNFLYHKSIASFAELEKYVQLAIEDYNNRPHNCLNGLTPAEVVNGKLPAAVNYASQLTEANSKRLIENKKLNCCYHSF